MIKIAESFPNHDETYIYKNCHCSYFPSNRKKYFLIYQVFCYLNKHDKSFEPPKNILGLNDLFTFLPMPNNKLQKFINGGGSNIYNYYNNTLHLKKTRRYAIVNLPTVNVISI